MVHIENRYHFRVGYSPIQESIKEALEQALPGTKWFVWVGQKYDGTVIVDAEHARDCECGVVEDHPWEVAT